MGMVPTCATCQGYGSQIFSFVQSLERDVRNREFESGRKHVCQRSQSVARGSAPEITVATGKGQRAKDIYFVC